MSLLSIVIIPPLVELPAAVLGLIVGAWAVGTLIRKGLEELQAGVIQRHKDREALSWLEKNQEQLQEMMEEDAPCKNRSESRRSRSREG